MLSVIIPTYNEWGNIEPLIGRLDAVKRQLEEPLEVLIVDDASPDGTAKLAGQLLSISGLGRVIQRTGQRDVSLAVGEGLRNAQGELVGVMDADLSHPPELLPALVQAVRNGCDLAIASRYVHGGGVEGWSWRRRWLSRLGNLIAHPLVRVHDATSGYFVCHAKAMRELAWQACGFKVLLELLVKGQAHRVQEIPYVFSDRRAECSNLGPRVVWSYGTQLARLYGYRLWGLCRCQGPA